jgi:regulator of sirC expression with transglutaminase-like and TPR domain
MDSLTRFAQLIELDDPPLDLGALLIAQHNDPRVDIGHWRRRLDELAEACADTSIEGICEHLFARHGFRGNRAHYDDPANSYLNQVLESRLGIPITLSVVLMEVSRRLGVGLVGVGLPGHFLVRLSTDPDAFIDAFDQGARLDAYGCEQLLGRLHGKPISLHPSWLAAVSHRSILWRMLGNLKMIHTRSGDQVGLHAVLSLRCTFPEAAPAERAELTQARAAFN